MTDGLTAWRGLLACLFSALQPGSLLILPVFSFTVFAFSFFCHTLPYEHFTTVFLREAQQQLHTHTHTYVRLSFFASPFSSIRLKVLHKPTQVLPTQLLTPGNAAWN